ncbi:MAG TPA: low molecular weight protein-tyrosine-phosphatase [Xanthomonadaceae bacterium]|jgi:protein-tyrosine phosphatase|nr:low molecular weight protein-tyrosine-phosphatase [Xanthomonadaceae bacterium]
MMNTQILIVCMGNICRSPMAEGLLRHKLAAAGLADRVRVDSAGTGPWHVGKPPDKRAVAVCLEHGIAIGDLSGRQITPDDFTSFDWVLCADRYNLGHLHALAPRPTWPRIALLLAWAGLGARAEVPDPYSGTIEDFRDVFGLLDKATDAMLTRLQLPA